MSAPREGGGTTLAGAVWTAAAARRGIGAAGLQFVKVAKLPGGLRDDSLARSLASLGYVMLHAIASAPEDDAMAELATGHLDGTVGLKTSA